MKKETQRQKKKKIVAGVLEQSQNCLFKKTIEKAIYKSFLRGLRPFIIVNAKKIPSEIVNALEREYILVDRGPKSSRI